MDMKVVQPTSKPTDKQAVWKHESKTDQYGEIY